MNKKDQEAQAKNFCEICGLKIKIEETSNEVTKRNEKFFKKLNELELTGKKIHGWSVSVSNDPSPERNFYEFCAVGLKEWEKKGEGCKSFKLKLGPLNLSDYISIYSAEKIARSQNKLLIGGIFVSIIGLLVLIFTTEIRSFLICLFKLIFH